MSASHAVRRTGPALLRIVLLATLPLVAAGCGGRQTIEGTVTLDDQPLEQGYINFRPMPKAKGPPVGSPIEKGKYVIRTKDAMEGDYRVEITSLGKTGRKTRDGAGKSIDIEGQVLPARYNSQSTLQIQIKPGQHNEFPFALTSK
jgi:hypothetical protein